MSAPQIRADHDSLKRISQIFARQAADSQRVQQGVRRQIDTLQGGDWIGLGANKFYGEMSSEIMPALKKLSAAMQAADRVTRQISQILQDADQRAAVLFRLGLAPGLGLGTPAPGLGPGAGGADGVGADGSSSLQKAVLSAYETAVPIYKVASGAETLIGFAGKFVEAGMHMNKGWVPPKALEFIAKNPYMQGIGKGFAVFGAGVSLSKLIDDPSVKTGTDFGVSSVGLVGSMVGGPTGMVTGAFAGGYAIGSLIEPYTTPALSNALTKWDPLDLGYSPRNYPRTTIKDYERSGNDMSMGVARDVYSGLLKSSVVDAASFAKEYSDSTGISTDKFLANPAFGFIR
jgi:WXG100 family type VII secretion target